MYDLTHGHEFAQAKIHALRGRDKAQFAGNDRGSGHEGQSYGSARKIERRMFSGGLAHRPSPSPAATRATPSMRGVRRRHLAASVEPSNMKKA